jgi:predicted AAA+ superfamily ATPase
MNPFIRKHMADIFLLWGSRGKTKQSLVEINGFCFRFYGFEQMGKKIIHN